ncbi:MAG: DUF2892 domain-containing protein [Luteibaculaceae bacterium]
MNTQYIKLALFALIQGFSIYLFINGNWGWGIFLIFPALLVLLTFFRNENIIMALFALRKQDVEKAEKAVNRIKNPEHLLKGQQAYYWFLKGILEGQKQSVTVSEKYFKKALSLGLRMKQDQAMAKLNLAGIAMAKRRKREAEILLSEVKKLDKEGMLKDQVKMLKQQMGRI